MAQLVRSLIARLKADDPQLKQDLALRKQGLSLRQIAHREKRSASGVLQILRRAGMSGGLE